MLQILEKSCKWISCGNIETQRRLSVKTWKRVSLSIFNRSVHSLTSIQHDAVGCIIFLLQTPVFSASSFAFMCATATSYGLPKSSDKRRHTEGAHEAENWEEYRAASIQFNKEIGFSTQIKPQTLSAGCTLRGRLMLFCFHNNISIPCRQCLSVFALWIQSTWVSVTNMCSVVTRIRRVQRCGVRS